MTKAAPKKKAPVQLTAGTGFRNENCIGARFLLDLLAGTNTLGVDFGKIDRLQWQGRDLGWLADDLVVECTISTGKRSAGISIKSDRQVTGAGFPSDFVGVAWAQWFGVKTERVLRGSDDATLSCARRFSPGCQVFCRIGGWPAGYAVMRGAADAKVEGPLEPITPGADRLAEIAARFGRGLRVIEGDGGK